jgi:hypothetical protein
VRQLLEEHGLTIVDVERNKVNGGSLRLYVQHMQDVDQVSESVYLAEQAEMDYLDYYWDRDPYLAFADRVERIKKIIVGFLETSSELGLTTFAMGASTKGNTLLQYFGITSKLLPYAAEVNPDKFGTRTVGTNIPIINEQEALSKEPDFFLVLPWHFIDMLVEVHKPYLESGGKFIVPMPVPMVYSHEEGKITTKPLHSEFTKADEISLNSLT